MPRLRDDPFPFEAARDLLGILRALYAASRAAGAPKRRLLAIRDLGVELRRAVDMALEHEPHTFGHAAAWASAERVTRQLSDLIDVTTPLGPTLSAAAERVNTGSTPEAPRELARRARTVRG